MFLRFRKRTPIKDLRENALVVVEGKVVAKGYLSAPGSRTRCVYHETMIERFGTGSRARGRAMWLPERFDRNQTGFFVEDKTGKVWVDDEVEDAYLTGGLDEMGPIGNTGRSRFAGRVVREGDLIRVRGVVSPRRKSEPEDVLVLRATDKGRMEILVRKLAKVEKG